MNKIYSLTKNKVDLLFLVNGTRDGIFGRRVRELSENFLTLKSFEIYYRENKVKSFFVFVKAILTLRPDVIYVEQIAFSACMAALFCKCFVKFTYVFCTSDAYAELVRSNHNDLTYYLAKYFEKTWLRSSDIILTCNPMHSKWVAERYKDKETEYVEHGVDVKIFKPLNHDRLSEKLKLKGFLVVGLIGSLVWSKRYNFCYGWELIEAMRYLRNMKILGLIIGEGTGLYHLKQLSRRYNVQEKIIFTGFVPHEEIANYMNCIDICLSTQSNDLVGELRCPTKLSEYMACGKYIIATDVGYAKLYVDKVGKLIPYMGVKDNSYPKRIAHHIEHLYNNKEVIGKGRNGVEIARTHFTYKTLGSKLESIVLNHINSR